LTVRTRVAPSPTGDPHLGTAYTALFNYCFARKSGGQFLLRIEDTDRARSNPHSMQAIMDSLRWLGLEWNEGPDVGGDYGPYQQSLRSDIYRQHADQLLEQGHAFRCYCTPERLAELRKSQQMASVRTGYDGHCLNLSSTERAELDSVGTAFVIRLRVPDEGTCRVDDLLRGKIEIDWRSVDMQILVKQDSMPTYHLANVVDDHLMQISHVIRGEEWISSAPKHLLLYNYFGWTPPTFCHMPLLRNPNKSKLSKRHNTTSILYYQRMGFLPETLLNYLGLMAWSMPDGEEKFSLDAMVDQFDLKRISLGGPVFDAKKLTWLNGRWIRESLTDEQFAERVERWALNRDYLMKIVPLVKERVSVLSELGPLASFFVSGNLNLTAEDFQDRKVSIEVIRKRFKQVLEELDTIGDWNKDAIAEMFKKSAKVAEIKLRDYLAPFYIAIAGSLQSTPLFDSMEILGKDLCRARLRDALQLMS
jgi:glutamyl-tRNA synthetase